MDGFWNANKNGSLNVGEPFVLVHVAASCGTDRHGA